MKRYLLIILALLALTGCAGKKHSLKVTDPAERAALRTRDASCPIDSIFSAKAVKTTFNVVGQVKPKALVEDFKAAQDTTIVKPVERAKTAYASVKELRAGEYSPGLTIYSAAIVLLFVIMMLVKILRALFKND